MPGRRRHGTCVLDDFPSTGVQGRFFPRLQGTRPEGDESMGRVVDRERGSGRVLPWDRCSLS